MEKDPNNRNSESLELRLQDSGNQINAFRLFRDLDEIKSLISQTEFFTLEDYLKETRETIDGKWPNICERYNALIEEFKKAEFDQVRFQEILKEAWEITHPK